MRILYHHRTLGDGAEGIHVASMVHAFRKLGHEVRMVGPAVTDSARVSPEGHSFLKVKRLAVGPVYELLELAYNLFGFSLLQRSLAVFKPHLIYDRYSLFNYSCVAVGRRHGVPVFLEVNAPLAYERDHEPDESLHFRKIAYSLETMICSRADRTVVVSTPLKTYLTSKGVPPEKVVVLPNGASPRVFPPRPKSSRLLQELGLEPSNVVIGFVGILRPWHGLDILLRAFQIVHDRSSQAVLLLVGDGPIRGDIERKASELKIQPYIRITGRVPHGEVNEHISLFDVAVCSRTTFYASPLKIPEYMAQGKAVVAPDTDNIRDLVVPGLHGVLFQPGSHVSLSDAILCLVEDGSLRDRMGKGGLHHVLRRLNWEANAGRIIDELKNVTGER